MAVVFERKSSFTLLIPKTNEWSKETQGDRFEEKFTKVSAMAFYDIFYKWCLRFIERAHESKLFLCGNVASSFFYLFLLPRYVSLPKTGFL